MTIKDMEGTDHTVEVTAATLYEAVALGIAAIRSDESVSEIARGLNTVKVRVINVAVEHAVRAQGLRKLARQEWGITTRDVGSSADQVNSGDAGLTTARRERKEVATPRPTD